MKNYNTLNVPSSGYIKIELEKLAFIGSETIYGMLQIDIFQEYKGHIVVVSIEGVEKVIYPTSKNNQQDAEYGVKKFINNQKPVYDFAAESEMVPEDYVLQPGRWSIPFTIKIHPSQIQTINLYKSSNNNCSVNFYISAYIVPTEKNQVPISGKQCVLIVQNKRIFEENYQASLRATPSRFCFLGTGKLMMDSSIERIQYSPGEEIQVKIDYNFTKFDKEVTNLQIKLVGRLTMKAESKDKSFTQEIECTSIRPQINSKKGQTFAYINIPVNSGLSQRGSLHQLEYFISITPEINDRFVSKIQSMKLPVQLQSSVSHLKNLKLPQINQPYWADSGIHSNNSQRQELVPQQLETINFDAEDFQEQFLYFEQQDTIQAIV